MNAEKMDDNASIPKIDIDDEDVWGEPPIVTFDQKASLQIAVWVLCIFAGVYLLCFLMGFLIIFKEGATFDGGLELVKFMLSAILPLVTLAVGYYLGDRNRTDSL